MSILSQLEHDLISLGNARAQPAPRRTRVRWRGLIAPLGATALAGAGVAIFGVAPGSGQLAALRAPEATAADLRSTAGVAAARLTEGAPRAFDTANGKAFVTEQAGRVCAVLPDFVRDSYGSGCDSTEEVENNGLIVSLIVGPDSPKRGVVMLVLPKGNANPEFTPSGGEAKPVEIQNGVVTFPVTTDGVLRWRTSEGVRSVPLKRNDGPSVQFADCGGAKGLVRMSKGQSPREACDRG